jgi:triphosphatase
MGVPNEIELKLEIEPDHIPRLESHPLLEAVATRREIQTLRSVYFDTDDFALCESDVALRVREVGGRYIQSIKASKEAQFLHRAEWEAELAGPFPDLALAKGTALEKLLKHRPDDCLKPRFETRVRRTLYRIEQDGASIELALDQGLIEAGLRLASVSEVELELKQGEPASLFHLARALGMSVPLRLAVRSKAERGYALVRSGEPDPVERAKEVKLEFSMRCGDAFKIVARTCLRQLDANLVQMCAGNIEGLHQLRIGLRRLRAAIVLFAPIVAGEERDRIKAELKWMTQGLGPARDLDVLIRYVVRHRAEFGPEQDRLAESVPSLRERRDWAYVQAAAMVRSQRFCMALLDIAEWIETGKSTRGANDEPIEAYAAHVLARQRKKMRKRGILLAALDVGERHKLRIQAKTFRYGTEFFASLFPGKKSDARREAMLNALKLLQDALGDLNDIATREALLAESGEDGSQAIASAAEADALIGHAEQAHAAFAKVKSFWKS